MPGQVHGESAVGGGGRWDRHTDAPQMTVLGMATPDVDRGEWRSADQGRDAESDRDRDRDGTDQRDGERTVDDELPTAGCAGPVALDHVPAGATDGGEQRLLPLVAASIPVIGPTARPAAKAMGTTFCTRPIAPRLRRTWIGMAHRMISSPTLTASIKAPLAK